MSLSSLAFIFFISISSSYEQDCSLTNSLNVTFNFVNNYPDKIQFNWELSYDEKYFNDSCLDFIKFTIMNIGSVSFVQELTRNTTEGKIFEFLLSLYLIIKLNLYSKDLKPSMI